MRKLAIFSASFSLGIFLAQYLLPDGCLLVLAAVCLGLGWASLLLPWELRRRGVVIFAALALGFGWNWLYARQVRRPMEALAGTEGRAVMTLCGYPERTDYGARAVVRIEGFPVGKAMLYGDISLLEAGPGQTVAAAARFESAGKIRDTDITGFTSKGIFLLAYGRSGAVYGPGTESSPRWLPLRLGRAMSEKLRELYEADTAGFLTAILTGDRAALSEGASIDLSEAGLSHILAVSGMHCGFLLWFVEKAVGRHRRGLRAACTVSVLAFYAALTGASPSVLRACVMVAFLVSAPLFRRDSDPPTALSAALFFILLANPYAAASVSLQLSFAAMAGLLWLSPKLYGAMMGERRRSRLFRWAAAAVAASVGALVFTAPLSAWYFGRLVLVSPLSSLLCILAAEGVFIAGLLSVLCGFICMPVGRALSLLPKVLTGYILRTAHLLAGLPYHAVYFTNPYLKYWLAYACVLIAMACILPSRTGRRYVSAALLILAALALSVKLGQRRYSADLDAVVLDVGQGQCVLLASRGRFALVDCGSGNGWISAGEAAADYLASMGCRRLDYLILTHYDFDHVSGVAGLSNRLDIGTLLAPEGRNSAGLREAVLSAAEKSGAASAFVEETQILFLGGAVLTVYPPAGEGGDNEEGISVLASAGELDLLITGDMDSATERRLLASHSLPDIEVLVAGHHGSKYSTSEELLQCLRPEAACISVGANGYGHPSGEVLERLARQGCTVWRTDLHGNIHLAFRAGQDEFEMRRD